MIDKAPDYQSYSLEDLYDVRRHINREKYPERYNLLVDEIERRESQIASQPVALTEGEPAWHETVRYLFTTFRDTVVVGCVAHLVISSTIYNLAPMHPTPTHTEPLRGMKARYPIVYVTPKEKIAHGAFIYFLMPGIPVTFALYVLLQHVLGVKLKREPTPETSNKKLKRKQLQPFKHTGRSP